MSKILAIDFGLKRTGLAISDASKMFAFGLDTIDSSKLMDFLNEKIPVEQVSVIVIGLPKNLNNTETNITSNVYLLKEAIQNQFPTLLVEFEDERFTSKMASQSMHAAGATKKQKKQKELIDKVSATIILQSYLSRS